MSKIGNAVMEVQELHFAGNSISEIAKITKMPVTFVTEIVRDLEEDWPEPEPDFG